MPPLTHCTTESLQRSIDRHRRVMILAVVCLGLLVAELAALTVLLVVA